MARKIIEKFIDDLDGTSDAAETVRFSIDGKKYEIDLTAANAERLRADLAPWIEKARKVPGKGQRGGRGRNSRPDVRGWARANGFDLPDRGRIPDEVREAYDAAH